MFKKFVYLLLFMVLLTSFKAEDEKTSKNLKVLFIGNSYTYGIAPVLNQMLAKTKAKVKVTYIAKGGYKLKQHYADAKTLKKIKEGKFDYVVLQEQSQMPSFSDAQLKKMGQFFKPCRDFDKLIKASGAKTAMFITWGRRDGDARNKNINPDFETMNKRLTASYTKIANELGAIKIPIGPVYAEIKKVDETLFKGLYVKDGSHPSTKGGYVSSLTIFKTLFKKDISKLKYKNTKITNKEKKIVMNAIASVTQEKEKVKKHEKK
jgi:hypothetical protein